MEPGIKMNEEAEMGFKRRKWEQVNVPEILFLSKQDVLWCFIYKVTKAQKAERQCLAAKSTVQGAGNSDRKRGWEEAGEVERGREGQMIQYIPQREKQIHENWWGKWWAN